MPLNIGGILMGFIKYLYGKIHSTSAEKSIKLVVSNMGELDFLNNLGVTIDFDYSDITKMSYVTVDKNELQEKLSA